jgi:hypothetical protein
LDGFLRNRDANAIPRIIKTDAPVAEDLKATIAASASPYGLGLATTVAGPRLTRRGQFSTGKAIHFSTGVSGPLFDRP